jgi:glycosyltransferase involved in cell wall biosynthesis
VRVNVVSTMLNFGYKLAMWMREDGVDAHCYAFDNGFARDSFEWENGEAEPPSWYHSYSGSVGTRPLWPRPALTQELRKCDVLLAAGGYEPILAHRTGKPYIVWSVGNDLDYLPFSRDSLHARACAHFQARALKECDRLIYSMLFQRQSSIAKLGLTDVEFLPAPMDPRKYKRMSLPEARLLAPAVFKNADFVVFAPARHQIDSARYHYKGNERIVDAFAAFKRASPGHVRLVMVKNGEYQRTEAYARAAGLSEEDVIFEPLYPRDQMRAVMSLPNVIVADQFNDWQALGFIGLETLLHEQILVTSFNRDAHASVYAETPPVLSASTVDEICARFVEAARMTPEQRAQCGARGRAWAECFHGVHAVIPRLVANLELVAAA